MATPAAFWNSLNALDPLKCTRVGEKRMTSRPIRPGFAASAFGGPQTALDNRVQTALRVANEFHTIRRSERRKEGEDGGEEEDDESRTRIAFRHCSFESNVILSTSLRSFCTCGAYGIYRSRREGPLGKRNKHPCVDLSRLGTCDERLLGNQNQLAVPVR